MKKLFAKILCFLVFTNICFSQERIHDGHLKIFNNNILSKHIIALDGTWYVKDFRIKNVYEKLIFVKRKNVPNDESARLSEIFGTATDNFFSYELEISGLKENFSYAIFSRQAPSSASEIWCNGNLVEKIGIYSLNEKNHKSSGLPLFAILQSDNEGNINLKIKTSNFSKFYTGIPYSILFSEKENIVSHIHFRSIIKIFLIDALFFIIIFCLMNFFRKKNQTENIILAIFFFANLFTNIFIYGNLVFDNLKVISFEESRILQIMYLWLTPILFSLIILKNSQKKSVSCYVNNIFIFVFLLLGLIFSLLMILGFIFHSNKIFDIAYFLQGFMIFTNFVFVIYVVLKCALIFSKGQTVLGLYLTYYIALFLGAFFDTLFINYFSKQIITCTDISIFGVILFYIIIEIYKNQLLYRKSTKNLKLLKTEITETFKFIPHKILWLLNKNPITIENGGFTKINTSILVIRVNVYFENQRAVLPKVEFESVCKYLEKIADCIEKENGTLLNYFSTGCIAAFTNSPKDAFLAAKRIIENLKKIQTIEIFNSLYSSKKVSFSGAVHFGKISIGEIGNQARIGNNFFGEMVEELIKIQNTAEKNQIDFLFSENFVNELNETLQDEKEFWPTSNCLLEKQSDLIVNSDNSKINLYKCIFDNTK